MKRYEWAESGDYIEHPDGPWVLHGDARAVIDGLQALLNERDAELDRLKGSDGVDFNSEFLLPAPSDPTWAVPVRLNFDGAEGEGRLWLSVDPEHDDDEPSIAVEGRENARTLARLLLAWPGDK